MGKLMGESCEFAGRRVGNQIDAPADDSSALHLDPARTAGQRRVPAYAP